MVMMAAFKKYGVLRICLLITSATLAQETTMARIEAGTYIPLYGNDTVAVQVDAFLLDKYPVRLKDYLQFVKKNPMWKRSNVKSIFADNGYLKSWESDIVLGDELNENAAVNYVSWFAAKAYCECQGKRLPTLDEWEYVAMADAFKKDARKDVKYTEEILSWYETPNTAQRSVGQGQPNYWGVYDMHDLVWEWTMDYNSVMLSGESRRDVDSDQNLFCGAASIGATDLMNYAAFMRYAFRGSIKARYAVKNLGFRCASDIN